MGLIHVLLNLAGLLLWLNWRAIGLAQTMGHKGVSLLSTLQRPEVKPAHRWPFLAALIVLLALRSFVYWQMGPPLHWQPSLNLVVFHLSFRSDYISRMELYSLISFALFLAAFYLWLLFFVLLNRNGSEADAIQKLARLHLGVLARCPAYIQAIVPFLAGGLLWGLGNPFLVWLGLTPQPKSISHFWQEAVVLGLGTYLTWEVPIIGLLLLHLINSYLYLGNHPLWVFVSLTSRNLLRLLRWLPMRIGRIDFAPVALMGLTYWGSGLAAKGLHYLYRHLPW